MGKVRLASANKRRYAARLSLVPEAALALACTGVLSYLGISLFALPEPVSLTIGPIAGLVATLACQRWWLAGLAAGLGVAGGTALGASYLTAHSGAFRQRASELRRPRSSRVRCGCSGGSCGSDSHSLS